MRYIPEKSGQFEYIKDKSPVTIFTITILTFFLFASFPLSAAISSVKTPNDVYYQVELLIKDVHKLRIKNKITTPWPHVKVEDGYLPKHVLQKALEVLGKINSYRVNVAKTGGIALPRYPGRDIAPNEVYNVVVRLRMELGLLIESIQNVDTPKMEAFYINRTPNHVYAALSEVSIALEDTLGLRGISPSEVYMRSMQIIDLVRFLRRSQGLPLNIDKPLRTHGKLPNHALKAVHALQTKIHSVERNLWMRPLKVAKVPRRVITPGDVYDALGVVIAELQSIQYRLGLERAFPDPSQQIKKNSDDVIQNVLWALHLLPEFELGKSLQQYDRSALGKTPDHVYSVTEHMLDELIRYRRMRGIKTPLREKQLIPDIKPKHVYAKGLEVLQKVEILRRNQQLGPITVPRYPLRNITPSEVFELMLRLDEELTLLYEAAGMESQLWITLTDIDDYEDKQSSDVFYNLQSISNLLDTILGSEGSTPNDVYREALTIKRDVQIIAKSLGTSIPATIWSAPGLKPATQPGDVLAYTKEVLKLIVMAKRRAGMFEIDDIAVLSGKVVTPTEVFNQVQLIGTELTELKVFLDISGIPKLPAKQLDKTPAHVLQTLEGVTASLRIMLHIDGENP